MRILLNYDYRAYPSTTASYIEMALRADKRFEVFRVGENHIACADIYINIEPCEYIVRHPGRKSCFWEIDNHIHQGNDTEKYEQVDYVFTAQKTFTQHYPMKKTWWVPLGADPDLHRLFDDEKIEYDIGFLGNDNYPKRRELLDRIGAKYKLLRSTAKAGEEYSRMLSRCKLTFNCAMDRDINMRFFEAIASGRMLLSDRVDGQDDLMEDGVHYVSYDNWEDLDKKIEYYLSHDVEREKIASEGAKFVHAFHSYRDRLNRMLEIMKVI